MIVTQSSKIFGGDFGLLFFKRYFFWIQTQQLHTIIQYCFKNFESLSSFGKKL